MPTRAITPRDGEHANAPALGHLLPRLEAANEPVVALVETFTSTMLLGELLSAQGWHFTDPTKQGCRGGAHKQRQITTIVGNIPELLFLGEAMGAILMNNNQCANKQSKLCTKTMCLINAQSVRNKVPQLTDYIIEHDFEV